MSRRRKLSGGLAFAPLIWKQADMLVGVGTLVLEFGIPEALAATGLMIAFGP